jgi:beta-lactamase class A
MMKRSVYLLLSLCCLLIAGGLTFNEWQAFQSVQHILPYGTRIAGLPVGGLNEQAAGLRVVQVYSLTPVELTYAGERIQITPEQAGFALDLEGMLSAAQGSSAWTFADYLFERSRAPSDVPLQASFDEERLTAWLREHVDPRLSRQASAARPSAPGDLTLAPGQAGQQMDLASAQPAIAAALFSPDQRVVALNVRPIAPLPPQFADLEPMLEAVVQAGGFPGAFELYLQDVDSGQEIRLAYNLGRRVAPGIAFTGASTIKIPVLVSAFRQVEGELPASLRQQMELMIDLSDNGSTDEVMQLAFNSTRAPLQVTEDMRALGLESTFLAGFFYQGAALLDLIDTPANTRQDVRTDPDIYNQTTPAEIGWLLGAVETCAESGSGPLIDTFGGQITQSECQLMTDMLKNNRKSVLLEAGLPEGTPLAHKYGWVTDFRDGLLHTASDVGVVYTPGGRFVISVFLYDSAQLQWDPAQLLVARLARAAYNFYNYAQE